MPVTTIPKDKSQPSPDEGRIAAMLAQYYQAAAIAGVTVNASSFADFETLVREHIDDAGDDKRVAMAGWLFKFLSEVLLYAADNDRDYLGEDGVAHARKKTCKVYPFCKAKQ